nr:hypothetical protein [uncultured Dyadobacter sp.]
METKDQNDKDNIVLIIENGESSLWGRVQYDDDLLIDEAATVEELQEKMKALLQNFHNLNPGSYQFRIAYDLTLFFEKFDFLKVTKIAEISGINGSLLRQYASGKKHPSAKQAAKIESAIKQLAKDLAEVHIYAH